MSYSVALCLTITALLVYDWHSTLRILRLGGIELNPLMVWWFNKVTAPVGMALAKGGSIAALWAAWLFDVWATDTSLWTLIALALWYSYLMVNNYRAIRKLTASRKGKP